ncbi:aminotransferase class I/II-fold pyridoxal phosphate-dependent enzyme [Brachyspira sp. SAP_772]|uniref:aminotransferase class I/II-fold pyridoxal phosphate-dependent enzyme n=1 Tax=Brachyspira sp. SAP_772 TaxID=2608385 RepID=UPI0012F4A59F|nr:aminotransferase class I/II-fold pyridoxal phosphate-dependent enzyme [Brachyspira sp. SAP_772]
MKKEKKEIYLDKNENPYKPSKNIIKELESFDIESFRLFPDYSAKELDLAMANNLNIDKDNIISVNGMYEAFYCVLNSFENKKIFLQEPYRDLYKNILEYSKIDFEIIKAKEDYNIDLDAFNSIKKSIIITSNPNAETGLFIENIEKYINNNNIYVIDESYISFAWNSALRLIDKYDNLIIISSIAHSHSLSALNINFLISNKINIEKFSNIRQKYGINKLSEKIAISSINDKETVLKNVSSIVLERDKMESSLSKEGFLVLPSKANFLLIKHPNKSSKYIYDELKKNSIFVKSYEDSSVLKDFLRITISDSKTNNILLKTLYNILN